MKKSEADGRIRNRTGEIPPKKVLDLLRTSQESFAESYGKWLEYPQDDYVPEQSAICYQGKGAWGKRPFCAIPFRFNEHMRFVEHAVHARDFWITHRPEWAVFQTTEQSWWTLDEDGRPQETKGPSCLDLIIYKKETYVFFRPFSVDRASRAFRWRFSTQWMDHKYTKDRYYQMISILFPMYVGSDDNPQLLRRKVGPSIDLEEFFRKLSSGVSVEDILSANPSLSLEAVHEAFHMAAEMAKTLSWRERDGRI